MEVEEGQRQCSGAGQRGTRGGGKGSLGESATANLHRRLRYSDTDKARLIDRLLHSWLLEEPPIFPSGSLIRRKGIALDDGASHRFLDCCSLSGDVCSAVETPVASRRPLLRLVIVSFVDLLSLLPSSASVDDNV